MSMISQCSGLTCISYGKQPFTLEVIFNHLSYWLLTFLSVDGEEFIVLLPFDDVVDFLVRRVHAVHISGLDPRNNGGCPDVLRQDVLMDRLKRKGKK